MMQAKTQDAGEDPAGEEGADEEMSIKKAQ